MVTNQNKKPRTQPVGKTEKFYKWITKQIDKFTPKEILKLFPEKDRIFFIIIVVISAIFFKAYNWIVEQKYPLYMIIVLIFLIILFIGIDRHQENKKSKTRKKNKS